MIDFKDIGKFKENNRIEAKESLGGLSRSIWETYSAFANTFGGIILLGVKESKDKSFTTVLIPNPEKLVKEFWDIINNKNKVNVNILIDENVRVVEVDGNQIIVIEVPRANRHNKPVYIDGDLLRGTYRRNGEGDYHCTETEIRNMIRDGGDASQDLIVFEKMDFSVFDKETLSKYRNRFAGLRPGHAWVNLSDDDFFQKLGAVGISEIDMTLHPTAAGLLMFGYEYEIAREFPNYFLDYQERFDAENRWSDRIISNSGDWSGNLFDFYFRVYNKIAEGIKTPFTLEHGSDRIDDTPVHKALREALANTLIHANYLGEQGLVIIKKKDSIIFSNPGSMRISIAEAVSGGLSDPRNTTLMKMFSLVGIGERAGSGLHNIHDVWKQQGWRAPILEETFGADKTILSLKLSKSVDRKVSIKSVDKSVDKTASHKRAIIKYLTDNPSAKSSEISELLSLGLTRVRELIAELQNEGVVVSEGSNRDRSYKLK